MNHSYSHRGYSRREFLRRATGASLALTGGGMLPGILRAGEAPAILPVKNPNSKLQLAVVGLGGISGGHLLGIARDEHLVALCECDPARQKKKYEEVKAFEVNNVKPEDMKQFQDYREMLEQMAGKLDGVVVCTPDHNHAIIALDCMKRGIHVFVEKPMSHNIHEAYTLLEAARRYRVATAMGNEGHTWEATRVGIEHLLAGSLGAVTEIYHWCVGRTIGSDEEGLEEVDSSWKSDWWLKYWSVPVPEEIARKAYRYAPGFPKDPLGKPNGGDRRWMSGSLGDWGPHTMDTAFWGLRIGDAPSYKIELLERRWGGPHFHYKLEVYRWTIPPRGDLPELKEYWYHGVRANPDPSLRDEKGEPLQSVKNFPPKALALQKQYDYPLQDFGSLIIGEKGSVITGGQGGIMRWFPPELSRTVAAPPRVLKRIEIPRGVDSNRGEWYHAIRTGDAATTCFDRAVPFTEHYLSGLFASRAPEGAVVEYDAQNHRVKSHPELNQYLTRPYRPGYEVQL